MYLHPRETQELTGRGYVMPKSRNLPITTRELISDAKAREFLLPSSSWGSHWYGRSGYREEPQVLDYIAYIGSSVQFSSVAQSCPTLCDTMNCSTPGLPVHHQLPEFTQTHVHWVSDAIEPSHPGLSPSSPAPNPSQHQSLFQWVNSLHEVAKVLEFQL